MVNRTAPGTGRLPGCCPPGLIGPPSIWSFPVTVPLAACTTAGACAMAGACAPGGAPVARTTAGAQADSSTMAATPVTACSRLMGFSSRLDFRLDAPAPALVPQCAEGQISRLWRPRVAARWDPPAVAEALGWRLQTQRAAQL